MELETNLKLDINTLKTELITLKDAINFLNAKIEKLELKNRRNNIVIFRVTPPENSALVPFLKLKLV